MLSRREGPARPWPLYLLALLTAGVVAFAITQIGPPTSSARTSRQVITAQDGVVQSTVSGTGNVSAGTDVSVNFQTSGTIATVLVHQGQHVIEGQLMATLDPTAAQLTVDQASEQLTAAQDQLTALQNGTATGSGSASGAASSGTGSASSASTTVAPATAQFVSATVTTPVTAPKRKKRAGTTTPPTRITTPPTRTTSTPARTTTTPTRTTSTPARTTTTPTTTTTTPSPASLASAQAAIYSAQANLRTAQLNLAKTRLYAPATGTIVSLSSLTVGDSVSAGSTAASSAGGSGSGSGSGAGATSAGASTAGGLGSGGTSTGASGSGGSSSAFAEIVDASSMTMTVSFSESDITKVRVGQPATVTVDALSGVELGAHVSAIATVGTTSSSVVSYPATLTLDQLDPRVKPGMSASASVIVGQAQGVTVPTQAISGSGTLASVNMLRNGQTVSQPVVVGLRGDSRAQIVSGLAAGQQLVITVTLPSLSSSSSSSGTGTLGGRLGGGLGGGGLGGGGGAFLRGAGGGGAVRLGGGG